MTIITEKEIGRIIHLTGLNTSELVEVVEKEKSFVRCYICKRREGDESVAFTPDSRPVTSAVEIFKYRKRCKDVVYTWSICVECAWLLDLLSA